MSLPSVPDPENTRIDQPIEDSGVHIRDTEHAPASLWQMTVTALLVITILVIFFYGVTEQRTYVAGLNPPKPNIAAPSGNDQRSATASTPAPKPSAQPTAPATPEGGATTGAAPSR